VAGEIQMMVGEMLVDCSAAAAAVFHWSMQSCSEPAQMLLVQSDFASVPSSDSSARLLATIPIQTTSTSQITLHRNRTLTRKLQIV